MSAHDAFLDQELEGMLEPGEQVVCKGFLVEMPNLLLQALLLGGLLAHLMTKFYYGAATDRRLILIRTKPGFFSHKPNKVETQEIRYDQVASLKTGAFLNQKKLVFGFKDGGSRTIKLNTLARQIEGQKQFFEQVPPVIQQRLLPA